MSDVVDLILNDHQRICRWLDALGPGARPPSRGAPPDYDLLWRRLARLVDLHTQAEQEIFYPAVVRVAAGTGADLTDALADQDDLREAVQEASFHPAGSAPWWPLATAVRGLASRHIAREEGRLLVAFTRAAPSGLREELGGQWAAFTAARLADAAAAAAAAGHRG